MTAAVARRVGYRELVLPLTSSNRFERHLVNYVGALVQSTIAAIEIGSRSFDELAAHTWTTVLEASRHGQYDTVKRDAVIGLAPLTTPDRILVDYCWVEIADVQHLVADAVAPAGARVFASAGGCPKSLSPDPPAIVLCRTWDSFEA